MRDFSRYPRRTLTSDPGAHGAGGAERRLQHLPVHRAALQLQLTRLHHILQGREIGAATFAQLIHLRWTHLRPATGIKKIWAFPGLFLGLFSLFQGTLLATVDNFHNGKW